MFWNKDKAPPPAPVAKTAEDLRGLVLTGGGDYETDVVGESHYQEALAELCGGHCEDGHEQEFIAVLFNEADNPHDRNAIAVLIGGKKVGYLSREVAAIVTRVLTREGYDYASCSALVTGGWRRDRPGGQVDEGRFGVKLDLVEDDDEEDED